MIVYNFIKIKHFYHKFIIKYLQVFVLIKSSKKYLINYNEATDQFHPSSMVPGGPSINAISRVKVVFHAFAKVQHSKNIKSVNNLDN